MILTPTCKLHTGGKGFKAIVRLDSTEYHLPGVHETSGAAMQQAQLWERECRNILKRYITNNRADEVRAKKAKGAP